MTRLGEVPALDCSLIVAHRLLVGRFKEERDLEVRISRSYSCDVRGDVKVCDRHDRYRLIADEWQI